MLTIDELATFCKKKGFVYPSAEIYGGLSGFFDYGPLGVELKNRIKAEWWRAFVHQRHDVVGIDGSLVNHPKIWQASGHVSNFNDVLVECTRCKHRMRADHLIEDTLKIKTEGLRAEDFQKLIEKNKVVCPKCKGAFSKPHAFNLMFTTFIGPRISEENTAYLRPETAQLMFTNFRLVTETARMKVPFGIAQIGKAFRNEISPRDFLFRAREFEQMEIEFFTHPTALECPFFKEVSSLKVNFLSAKEQLAKKDTHKETKLADLVKQKLLTEWHAYWIGQQYRWFLNLGVNLEHLRVREHRKDELAHYATACFDIEYKFPFGWKEIHGNAARGNFDLSQHQKLSTVSMELFDEEKKERFLPIVASEPSQGVDRAFLTFLYDAYTFDKDRGNVVLKLHPKLMPIQVGVFPLLTNKDELVKKAEAIAADLMQGYTVQYDRSGSVGRRYARADEIGILLCCTIDFQTLEDDTVTLRHRDTTKQIRVKSSELKDVVYKIMYGAAFEKCGTLVKAQK
jgi:glycyl-tRNA synthetase